MKDEPGIERFLDYFYKQCIETLFRPFQDVPEFKNLTSKLGKGYLIDRPQSLSTGPLLHLTRETTNRYLYVCDLLGNFALQHSFRSHFYMLSSNISLRVASLLRARDKHLKHGRLLLVEYQTR
jgi:protein phosphatase-4 regulatory subunit 3